MSTVGAAGATLGLPSLWAVGPVLCPRGALELAARRRSQPQARWTGVGQDFAFVSETQGHTDPLPSNSGQGPRGVQGPPGPAGKPGRRVSVSQGSHWLGHRRGGSLQWVCPLACRADPAQGQEGRLLLLSKAHLSPRPGALPWGGELNPWALSPGTPGLCRPGLRPEQTNLG